METAYRVELQRKTETLSRTLEMLGKLTLDLNEKDERLDETTFKLELALEASNVGLWSWNFETNEVWFSKSWKNQLGFQDNEIVNNIEEWRERIHPDDREKVWSQLQICAEDDSDDNCHIEYRIQHKDGSYLCVFSKSKISNSNMIVGCHVDITERKKYEDELKSIAEDLRIKNEELRLTFQYVPIGLTTVYMNGKFRSANPVFCKIIGYTEEELKGLYHNDITFKDDQNTTAQNLARLKDKECETVTYEKRYIHKDGSLIYAKLTVGLVYTLEAVPIFVTAITEDISCSKGGKNE